MKGKNSQYGICSSRTVRHARLSIISLYFTYVLMIYITISAGVVVDNTSLSMYVCALQWFRHDMLEKLW